MKGTVKEAHLSFSERLLRAFSYVVVHAVQRPKLMGPKPKLDQPTIFVCRHLGLMDPVIVMVEYYRMIIRPLVLTGFLILTNKKQAIAMISPYPASPIIMPKIRK